MNVRRTPSGERSRAFQVLLRGSSLALAGLLFFYPLQGSASALSASIPDFYSRSDASIVYRGLGHACSAISSISAILPCNPAFADSRKAKQFAAHLFIGNDTATIRRIDRLISGPHTQEFAESLFQDSRPIEMEASGEFSFRTRYFGAAFTPYRLTYFSMVSDSAYPVIALHAMSERTIRAMVGGEVEASEFGRTSAGIQLRAVNREFVQNEFTLFDAITDGETVLARRSQNAFFIEPGVAHVFAGDWEPRVTGFLSGVGFSDQDHEEIDQNPVLDLGAGVRPPLGFGALDLALNYRAARNRPDPIGSVRGAMSYSLGMLEAITAASRDDWSAGLVTRFLSARVGIVYAVQEVVRPWGGRETVRSTFTEFSLVF